MSAGEVTRSEQAPAAAGGGGGRRRGGRLLAALAVLATAGAGVWYAAAGAGQGGEPTGTTLATALAEVARRDMRSTETLDGTLAYAEGPALTNRLQGTYTWLPQEGAVIHRGQRLWMVDGAPVVLMEGSVPAWRPLGSGVTDGADVEQLERNLRALGYDPGGDLAVDQEWDWATTAAVKRWQEALGLEETGRVELGRVVFLPGPVRVGALTASVGSPAGPGGAPFEPTSTSKVVTVELEASRQQDVRRGQAVTVKLPDGKTTPGVVASVSRVAESQDTGQEGAAGEEEEPTVEVTITLRKPADTRNLDQAPVEVEVVSEERKGVLAVPVNALLALLEGGYAVEVDSGGSRRLVPVELGLFEDGYVEVRSSELREGTRVVVPE